VLVREADGRGWYDIWVAGGLGREPQPGFLLAEAVVEERIIPMIEAILRVYSAGAPAGKRLKHLLTAIGEEEFRRHLDSDPGAHEELPPCKGIPEILIPAGDSQQHRIEAHFFAGGLSGAELVKLCEFAETWSHGVMMVTVDQNIAFQLARQVDPSQARQALDLTGFAGTSREERITFRACPGTHECRAGLTPTRDIAQNILEAMGPGGKELTWAISGCHNSCTQPQLADVGIISSRLVAGDDGQRSPRFDLYRSVSEGLGQRVEASLDLEELLAAVCRIG
jgi:ferredoxin-nitrite reductase